MTQKPASNVISLAGKAMTAEDFNRQDKTALELNLEEKIANRESTMIDAKRKAQREFRAKGGQIVKTECVYAAPGFVVCKPAPPAERDSFLAVDESKLADRAVLEIVSVGDTPLNALGQRDGRYIAEDGFCIFKPGMYVIAHPHGAFQLEALTTRKQDRWFVIPMDGICGVVTRELIEDEPAAG